LTIDGNASLTSLIGLENLTSVGFNLSIVDNPSLTSLSGLENLTSVANDLVIQGNDALNNCNQLFSLLDDVNDVNPDYGQPVPDVGGAITIQGNLTNGDCGSLQDILDAGAPIPTMSQWGLFLFGLLVCLLGVVSAYNLKKRVVIRS
jgi:hypothetical protein